MKNIRKFLPLVTLVLCSQTGFAQSASDWISDDFFVSKSARTVPATKLQKTTDCRDRIPQILCWVDPVETGGPGLEDRPCLPGAPDYSGKIMAVHDALPPVLQKTFCSLNKIYIEKEIPSTGYGGVGMYGAIVGIRQSILDSGMPFGQWASWKEQRSFGGQDKVYVPVDTLPSFVISQNPALDQFLYQFFVHEFGHVMDFANDINKTENCSEVWPEKPWPECEFAANSWGSIAWITTEKPRPSQDFYDRPKFCFYSCNGVFADAARANRMYTDLYATSFINAYAATNPYDDFADSLAYYLFDHQIGGTIQLETRQGLSFDMTGKLNLPQFATKKAYVKNFLQRTDLVYPVPQN